MHPHRGTRLVVTVVAASALLGCQHNQPSQPSQAKPATPQGPICDIIPRKPVAQLFGSVEMHVAAKKNHLDDNKPTYYLCTISKDSWDPPSGEVLDVYLRPEYGDSGSGAPNGVGISTALGKGSVSPRYGFVYPNCNGKKYSIYIHAYDVGKGNRAAIKEIALAVVRALDEAQDCRETTASPSVPPG